MLCQLCYIRSYWRNRYAKRWMEQEVGNIVFFENIIIALLMNKVCALYHRAWHYSVYHYFQYIQWSHFSGCNDLFQLSSRDEISFSTQSSMVFYFYKNNVDMENKWYAASAHICLSGSLNFLRVVNFFSFSKIF